MVETVTIAPEIVGFLFFIFCLYFAFKHNDSLTSFVTGLIGVPLGIYYATLTANTWYSSLIGISFILLSCYMFILVIYFAYLKRKDEREG